MAEVREIKSIEMDYFYGIQAEQFTFYRIPKILFKDERLKTISAEAKILYGLLLDRMSLSMRNRWLDEENRVYIKYPVEEIMENLGCGKNKAVALLAELDTVKGIGLIEKRRKGLGEASWIYVKNFMTIACELPPEPPQNVPEDKPEDNPGRGKRLQEVSRAVGRESAQLPEEPYMEEQLSLDPTLNQSDCIPDQGVYFGRKTAQNQEVYFSNFLKFNNQTSGGLKNKLQEVPKSNPNDNKNNNIKFNNTDNLSYPSYHPDPKEKPDCGNGSIDGYDRSVCNLKEELEKNIDYGILCARYGRDRPDEILQLMLEILLCRSATVYIAGEERPAEFVKLRFMKLTAEHIEYVIECMDKKAGRIANIKQYLLSSLYNAPATIGHYYAAEANHDWYGAV